MKIEFESFIEKLYFGKLDKNLFSYEESGQDDSVVADLTAKFNAVMQEYPPAMLEEEGHAPKELLEKLAEMGFFGLIIPKKYGGLGLSLHQYAALVEEIAKTDMGVGIISLAHLSIGIKGIILYGNEEQKRKYLTAGASGKTIFCYALTEPLIGSDAQHITTKAEITQDGSAYILNGMKTYITNANYSGALTVFAQMNPEKPGTLGAFIVETGWSGVSIGKDMEKMGLKASSTASIRFTDVRVPKENMIGNAGDGFKIAMTILNYGRLGLGAASAGMLDVSYNDMVKRAKGRIQFGQPIINFEIIQEKIARARAMRDAVRAMTHFTAGLLEKDPLAPVAIESSHTKLYGTNRAWDTLYDALQTAGGAGFLKSQPYEKRARDSRVATIFEGTTEIHSIYPPLSLARELSKKMKSQKGLNRAVTFFSLKTAGTKWSVKTKHRETEKAVFLAKKIFSDYRKMFLNAVTAHGRNLPEKELLLRRLTTLSCLGYALISMTARINWLDAKGKLTESDLNTASFFTTIAENEALKTCGINTAEEEKAMKKLMKGI